MELVKIFSAAGLLEAEMIKSFLESYGISVFVNQESLGKTLGLSAGPLGLVEVLVPQSQVEEATSLLQEVWEDKQMEDFNNFGEQESEESTKKDSISDE